MPWGTFACNIGATILACLVFGALHSATVLAEGGAASTIGLEDRIFFSAVALGFCGSLSSVSALIKEVRELPRWRSMQYLVASMAASLVSGTLFFEIGVSGGVKVVKDLVTIFILSAKWCMGVVF